MRWLYILLGGGLGAIFRVAIVEWIPSRDGDFPWGVFAVNCLGCLAIGILFGLIGTRFEFSPNTRLALQGGFLGSLTTFSALGLDTFRLLESGATGYAAANALGSLAAGISLVFLGIFLGRQLN